MTAFTGYVWAAYGISLAVLAATVIVTVVGWQKAKQTLEARPVQDSETNI
jgi:heme exporter protein CcmD